MRGSSVKGAGGGDVAVVSWGSLDNGDGSLPVRSPPKALPSPVLPEVRLAKAAGQRVATRVIEARGVQWGQERLGKGKM